MSKIFSLVYAYRNREISRIESSMNSLVLQKAQNFEVVFVDYGSDPVFANELKSLLSSYAFVNYYYMPVGQKLWNKSKALNFGIKKATCEFIFIADVDLIFHSEATTLFQKINDPKKFNLFKLGYLNSAESNKLREGIIWNDLSPDNYGVVNGMILVPKIACEKVNGYDEFFHFYGAEDVDFFSRLENFGYVKNEVANMFFYHNWHPSFSGSEDKILTSNPRIKNIMRINQRHYQFNRDNAVTTPLRQIGMGEIVEEGQVKVLENNTCNFTVINILAHVEHFLREELPSIKGEVVKAEFEEDPYFNSFKYKIKKLAGRQTQTYCSLKEVNDMVLKEILFNYRDFNYSFEIKPDLKTIVFRIQL